MGIGIYVCVEIGEGDVGLYWIGEIGWCFDFVGLMCFCWCDVFGMVVVEDGVVEGVGLYCGVEVGDGFF